VAAPSAWITAARCPVGPRAASFASRARPSGFSSTGRVGYARKTWPCSSRGASSGRPRDEGAREEEVRRPPRVARRPGERRERRVVAEEDHRADALRREVPRRRRRQRAGRVPHRLDRSEAALLELRARGRGGLLEARVRGVDHRDRRARGAEPARGEVGEDAGLLAHIAQWNVLRRITSGSGGRCFVMVGIASSHSVMIRSCGKW
jgi:hypothetical protein